MLMIIVFIVTLIIAVPIAFVLGIVSLVGFLELDFNLLIAIPQRAFAMANSNSLMAIPLFIVFGELLELSGDIGRLMDFSRALVGRIKGGLAYVCLLLGFFLGGPLGTANAEAALLGSTIYPEMVKDGYEGSFTACFIATISVIGPLIPPGVLLVIYGVASDTSIAELFMAGVMPGCYLTIGLGIIIFLVGRKSKWPLTEWLGWENVFRTFYKALFSLFVPIFTLGIIMFGVATPTESAAVAAVFTLVVGMFIYRKIKIKDLPPLLLKSAVTSGAILIIVAMGGVLSWLIAMDQTPQKIASLVMGLTNDKYAVLLLIQIILFVVGCVMDATPAILILVPVFMPIIKYFGFDPVHFGLLMVFNLTIGLLTPPVGTVLYTTAMTTRVPVDRMVKSIWPWVVLCYIVLLFVAYVPQSIMWLPEMMRTSR